MSVSSASLERRRYPRATVSESQLLTADMLPEVGPTRGGVVINISEGGLALQLFPVPPLRSVHSIRLKLPGSDSCLEAKGTVSWVGREGRTGIRFIDVSDDSRERAREWVSNQPERPELQSPLSTSASDKGSDDFCGALQLIAERVKATTRATGVAIAVGDSSAMECYASAGVAPAIGAPLRPDAGLSGLCLRTGRAVRCADAQADARVDARAARQLNMRSAVILPIHVSGKMAGIFELFSSEPNAFSSPEMISQLDFFVDFLISAVGKNQLPELTAGPSTEAPQKSLPDEPAESLASQPAAQIAPDETAVEAILRGEVPDLPPSVLNPSFYDRLRTPLLLAVFIALLLSGVLGWNFGHKQHRGALPETEMPLNAADAKAAPVTPLQISFAPPSISEKVGSVFRVHVVLNGAQNLFSVPLEIVHDPRMLQVAGVVSGDMLGPWGTLEHREDSKEGRIVLTASRPASQPGMSGEGVVCTLIFIARAPGQSKLRINQGSLRDPQNRLIATDTSAATVTVAY